jgi:hypothetical protein
MPTNPNEAKQIYDIVNDYIGFRAARELTKRLVSEVGSETSNNSLKESLQMLYDLYHSNPAKIGTRDCAALHHDD